VADVNVEVLNAAAQATYSLDLAGGLRKATGLNLDPNGICLRLWGKEFNEAGPEMLALVGGHGLLLPGVSGAYASTPDHASLDITGDIDIRVEYAVTGSGSNQTLLSKWAASQQSYMARLGIFGTTDMVWSTTGANSLSDTEVPTTSVSCLRLTLDVDNGASGRTITYYQANTLDGPFTQFGQDTTAGVTSIFAGTAPLELGSRNGGTAELFTGRITRAEVRDGINGTVVANPDFRNVAPGTTSFADSTGKTWTINGSAAVV
jgi:hypothetical protein